MSDLLSLQEFFYVGSSVPIFTDPSFCRLVSAWAGNGSGSDLYALLRHVLRREEVTRGGFPSLTLPAGRLSPGDAFRFGLRAELARDRLVVSAQPWKPAWLPKGDPERPILAAEPRRHLTPAEGDPFLVSLRQYDQYTYAGQRSAVRSALCAPPGSTTAILLPTGAGKSLVGQAVALLEDPFLTGPGTTVVVVPTVALGHDQDLVASKLMGHSGAYFGSEAQKEAIRNRVRSGEQRVVLVSPESLMMSLRHALYECARAGHLRALVIDEAHIVAAWGESFRSEFQELSGLWRRLSAIYPPLRTYLMTATLTEQGMSALRVLFTPKDGAFRTVASLFLRPEPAYYAVECATDAEKQNRLLESIDSLPRPLIVYTTRRDDANNLHGALQNRGYRRLSLMTGNTKEGPRNQIIQDWSSGEIDMVVGTSAFGLGIDKADVRAVIHACVPESLDRFYQEVGRGGRDGLASLSLMLYTRGDVKIAENMASQRVTIGIDRGGERWQRMFQSDRTKPLEDDRYRVPIDLQPTFTPEDIDMRNVRNEDWNSNTLTLMARAGLIELDDEPDMESDRKSRVVRLLSGNHSDPKLWAERVTRVREESMRDSRRQFALLTRLLGKEECVGAVFRSAYEWSDDTPVAENCGGCEAHRWIARPWLDPETLPPVWESHLRRGKHLIAGWPASPVGCVFYEGDSASDAFLSKLRFKLVRCLREGFRALVIDGELRKWLVSEDDDLTYWLIHWGVFVDTRWSPADCPRVPTVLVVTTPFMPARLSSTILKRNSPVPLLAIVPDNAQTADGKGLMQNFSGPNHRFEGWL